MSTYSTEITKKIDEYLYSNFSSDDDFLVQLKKEALEKGIPDISISSIQARFLQFLIKMNKAKYIIEIGSLAGYSAISMARALPDDGKLLAIEKEKEFADFIDKKIKEADLTNKIDVVIDDALNFLEDFNPNIEFDIIFIDAEKTQYIDYAVASLRLLKPGGIIIADNALAFGEIANTSIFDDEHRIEDVEAIRKFNLFMKNNPNLFTTLVPIGDGFLMSLKL